VEPPTAALVTSHDAIAVSRREPAPRPPRLTKRGLGPK
jgi:hypothetical protein